MALHIFSFRKKKTVFLLKNRQCSPVSPPSPVNVHGDSPTEPAPRAGPQPLSRALLPEPLPRFLPAPASPPICFQHSSRGALSECKSDHTHPLFRASPQPDDVPPQSVKAGVSQPHLPELVCLVFSLSLLLHQPLYSTNRPNVAQPQGPCPVASSAWTALP